VRRLFISGGFDPLHVGHLSLFRESAKGYGEVWAVLNTDEWLIRKKGYFLMPWEHRAEILKAIKYVDVVVKAKDDDGTVVETIKEYAQKDDWFIKGGDRTHLNTPEMNVCEELGMKVLFGWGDHKLKDIHSSDIVKKVVNESV
jgi:D-beta-D-heptose 7-phosphate kinase/D-beta-D-heptose 1-phosphate adenosyltransferase